MCLVSVSTAQRNRVTHSRKGCFWLKLATVAIATERELLTGSMGRHDTKHYSGDDESAGTCPCPLKIITMAGNEIHVVVPVSIHHNWETLEDYLVVHLSKSCGLDTFGCELTLLAVETV